MAADAEKKTSTKICSSRKLNKKNVFLIYLVIFTCVKVEEECRQVPRGPQGPNGGKKVSLIMFPQGGPAAASPAAPTAAAPAAAPPVLCGDYSLLLTY